MKSKKCTRCGVEKDFTEFQRRAASKDGLTASCRECLRVYDKERASLPHRVAGRKAYMKTDRGREVHRKSCRDYYKRHKEKVAASHHKWQELNPKKRMVHGIVAYAIRIGHLRKMPCIICGNENSHAHHCDYDKPLDVMWLCPLHHAEWHAVNGEGLNGEE